MDYLRQKSTKHPKFPLLLLTSTRKIRSIRKIRGKTLACRLAAKRFGRHKSFHEFYELNEFYEFYASDNRPKSRIHQDSPSFHFFHNVGYYVFHVKQCSICGPSGLEGSAIC